MAVLSRATLYGLVVGLTLAAALGWPYVVLYVLIVGPLLGAYHAISANKETDKSAR